MSPSLVPYLENDVHLVLCDFGRYGKSYMETDPTEAGKDRIVYNMIHGQYGRPISVVAFNPKEGWAWAGSQVMAFAVTKTADNNGIQLPEGRRAFVESHRFFGLAPSPPRNIRD